MKRLALSLTGLGFLGLAMTSLASLGGCERQLFRDTDTLNDRRVRYFRDYDGETAKATNERKKQAREWGLGLPGGFGSGE